MKRIHMPRIDARYWAAITLASIFGTNLGDLYAHTSGLGLIQGVFVLGAIALAACLVERTDRRSHEAYYWLVIILIRTGATNIADYLAFRVHIPAIPLSLGLAAMLAALAWRMARAASASSLRDSGALPDTGVTYWTAMLVAGVFGTVLGDVSAHLAGQLAASIGLGLILAAALLGRQRAIVAAAAGYWLTVAVARTAGTAIGDLLAENKALHIGLPLSTLITGSAFLAVLLLWRSSRTAEAKQPA